MFISYGQKFDVRDIQLKLVYRPDNYFFSGNADIKLESLVGGLGVVKFKFNPEYQVLRMLDEDDNDLYYTWDRLRETIYVYFLKEMPRGKAGRIRIFYRGNIPPPPVNTDVLRSGYGQNIDRFPYEYRTYLYSRRAFWYPAPANDDYFTSGFTISIPKGYDIISSGEEVRADSQEKYSENTEPGLATTRFESRRPVKYISFIAGRFRKVDRKDVPRPITYFQALRARPDHWNILEEAGKILSFYESRFGDYPFEQFAVIKRVWASGGGHSPPGFIVINELPQGGRFRLRLQSRSPVDFSQWQEYFLAHEIAHQWWGQGLSWKSYRDQWISEGLSQFSASLYLQDKYGSDAFSRIIKKFSSWTEKKAHWGGITMGSRISHFDFEAYQAIVYNKAALVLHMLKDYVGEELFFIGLQKFFSRKKYSPAGTGEFREIFHEISGLDLHDFFESWFESYKLPQVEIRKSVQDAGEGFELHIDLRQNESKFIFPLWVQWEEKGRKMKEKIIVDEKIEQYVIPVAEKPKKVKINPDDAVPGKFKVR